mgnify:CR=1 FL=1
MGVLYALESIRTPALDKIMSVITLLGGELFFMVIAVTVFWCVSKREGYYLMIVGFFGTVINQFLKILCCVPRPWIKDPDFTIVESARAEATGYSFPSGHTQNAVATYGGIARYTRRGWLRVVLVVLTVLIAFSRMYLGVHTPLDVGVSFVLALALAAALYPAFRTEQTAKKATPWILLGAAALCGGYLLYASAQARCDWPAGSEDLANITHGLKNAYTMMGALLGFLIVYFADEKKLRFDVHAPFWGQVLKLVLGLALIVAIKAGLKPLLVTLFAGSQAESFVRYFVIVIFAGIVWPLTFPFFANIGKKGKAA